MNLNIETPVFTNDYQLSTVINRLDFYLETNADDGFELKSGRRVVRAEEADIIIIDHIHIPAEGNDAGKFGRKGIGHEYIHILRILLVIGEKIDPAFIGDKFIKRALVTDRGKSPVLVNAVCMLFYPVFAFGRKNTVGHKYPAGSNRGNEDG